MICGCIGCRHKPGTPEHQRLSEDCLDCRRWEYLLAQQIRAKA